MDIKTKIADIRFKLIEAAEKYGLQLKDVETDILDSEEGMIETEGVCITVILDEDEVMFSTHTWRCKPENKWVPHDHEINYLNLADLMLNEQDTIKLALKTIFDRRINNL